MTLQRLQLQARHTVMTPEAARQKLIDELRRQGIRDEAVLAVMGKIPRHEFVDGAMGWRAYENNALPIRHAQTISQPYIVAFMTEALLRGRKMGKVLEIGTGSGYQTAVLSQFADTVYTVERIKALTEIARQRLAEQRYKNIHFGYADGMKGWLPYAPYDGIIVTAGAEEVPAPLLEQLAVGGRLIIPVGPSGRQTLRLIERLSTRYKETELGAASFVPLLGGKV